MLPPAHDLRRLITTQDIEQNVRVRMLAETGPFIIRVRSAGRSSVTFDVFTVNDWWHGQVERALQEECLAQIGRSAPKSSIGFQLDPVPTLAESWRELVRTYLGFLPWFARAKN